jgi:hypothetical protein
MLLMECYNISELQKKYNLQVDILKTKLAKKKNAIVSSYRNYDEFVEKINYHLIDKSGDKNFPSFYDVYDKIFTIEEEKESYEGFEEVLDFNYDQTLQRKFGPFKEVLLYCTTPDDKEVIGGINFSTYYSPYQLDKYRIFGTSHLFYLFVKPEYRFLNLGYYLLLKARKYSESLIAEWAGIKEHHMKFDQNQIVVFCEQNYPEKMTPGQYWIDNLNSLTDQCDRLIWWYIQGFRRLKFDYVQPSLNPENEPCTYLSLNAKVESEDTIPSGIILEHIRRIFAVSVLKGRELDDEINYKLIEEFLKCNSRVNFENNVNFLLLKQLIYKNSNSKRSPETLIGELIQNHE